MYLHAELSTEDPIRRVPDIDAQVQRRASLLTLAQRSEKERIYQSREERMSNQEIAHKPQVDNSDKSDDCKNGGRAGFCCVDKMHCSAQTEPVPVKVYREVSCECDIWSGETKQQCNCCKQVDSNPPTFSPNLVNHGMQTVAQSNQEEAGQSVSTQTDKTTSHVLTLEDLTSSSVRVDSIGVQYDNTGFLKDQSIQTDIEDDVNLLHVDANGCISSESLCSKLDSSTRITADAMTQASHCATVGDLQAQIIQLKEKLGLAESTVIWQSVMMKLYQM